MVKVILQKKFQTQDNTYINIFTATTTPEDIFAPNPAFFKALIKNESLNNFINSKNNQSRLCHIIILKSFFQRYNALPIYKTTALGKPFFVDIHGNLPQFNFSLSHTNDYSMTIHHFSQEPVGCDIQNHVTTYNNKAKLLNKVLSGDEKIYFDNTLNQEMSDECFFNLWSLKESYVKHSGYGIRYFKKVSFDLDKVNKIKSNTDNDNYAHKNALTKEFLKANGIVVNHSFEKDVLILNIDTFAQINPEKKDISSYLIKLNQSNNIAQQLKPKKNVSIAFTI